MWGSLSFKLLVRYKGYWLSSLIPVLTVGVLLIKTLTLFGYLQMFCGFPRGWGQVSGSGTCKLRMQVFPRSFTTCQPLRLSFLPTSATSDQDLFPSSHGKISLKISSFTYMGFLVPWLPKFSPTWIKSSRNSILFWSFGVFPVMDLFVWLYFFHHFTRTWGGKRGKCVSLVSRLRVQVSIWVRLW